MRHLMTHRPALSLTVLYFISLLNCSFRLCTCSLVKQVHHPQTDHMLTVCAEVFQW